MSTVDNTNIVGTKTGPQLVTEIQTQIGNADTELDLRPKKAVSETITGNWTLMGSFIASINAMFVLLGTGVQLRLVNENFFAAYNSHFHLSTTPGVPTSPPVIGLGIPGVHTTIQTTAS